jgi:MFS family permease
MDGFAVGLAYLPLALGTFVTARACAPAVNRFGPRPILLIGFVLTGAGLAWLGFADETSTFAANLLGPTLLIGLGEGMVIAAGTIAGTAGLPWQLQGLASGLINTTRQLGVALSLAVIVAVTAVYTNNLIASGTAEVTATAAGYGLAFFILAGIACVGFTCALFVPAKPKATAPTEPQAQTKEPALAGAG